MKPLCSDLDETLIKQAHGFLEASVGRIERHDYYRKDTERAGNAQEVKNKRK